MSHYVVAVKREQRENAAEDWFEPALAIRELRVLSPTKGARVIVEGNDATISRLRAILSPICHIEEVIEHRRRKPEFIS